MTLILVYTFQNNLRTFIFQLYSCFKECPIPISSVPISSTSGTSKSTGLTLTLQLHVYQKLKLMKLGKKLFNKKYLQCRDDTAMVTG